MSVFAYFDGASRSNPGKSGAGCYIQYGDITEKHKQYLGIKTNNEAEYLALILTLEKLYPYRQRSVIVHGDSKLVIEQMNGKWKVNAENLKPLFSRAIGLTSLFRDIKFVHIRRNMNVIADELANQAIEHSTN